MEGYSYKNALHFLFASFQHFSYGDIDEKLSEEKLDEDIDLFLKLKVLIISQHMIPVEYFSYI